MRGYFSEDDIAMIALITKCKKVSGKRSLEEKVVRRLVEQKSTAVTEAYNRIRSAEWYFMSARRADGLFRKMFIERVYALRVRNFAKAFGGAEVDMHFSLKKDLTSLKELFRVLREHGPVKTGGLLERGDPLVLTEGQGYRAGRGEKATISCGIRRGASCWGATPHAEERGAASPRITVRGLEAGSSGRR